MSIKMYGFWRSIASFRVRVALKLKDLSFEETPIDILSGEQFEPDYAAISAERVVPTFIHDGHTIFQSLAIIEYLDDIQPKPRLVPEDAKDKAYVRSLALMTVADTHPLVVPRIRNQLAKVFSADAKAIEDWGRHWTIEGLATYERLLARRKPSPFVLGAAPGLADICIAGHVVGGQYLKVDPGPFPVVSALVDRCFKMPEFASSHPFEQPGYKTAGAPH